MFSMSTHRRVEVLLCRPHNYLGKSQDGAIFKIAFWFNVNSTRLKTCFVVLLNIHEGYIHMGKKKT